MSRTPPQPWLILCTVDQAHTADHLAQVLLEKRLAACVSYAPCSSHYTWQGQLQHVTEYRLEIKTCAAQYTEIEKIICQNHPYEVPEILAIPILQGYSPYLAWLQGETDCAKGCT